MDLTDGEEEPMPRRGQALRFPRTWGRGIFFAAAALLLPACGNNVQVHGNLPDPELIAEIQPGAYRRQDVADLLGSPSAVSTFEDSRWYYIGQKVSQFAFLKPDVLERSILVVSFDGSGRVDRTRTYTLEDGQDIDPVDRITPTEGRDLNLLQELLGNIGRFPTDAMNKQ
ncbi:MAG: outer membrane protein assembly factor BamE [Rhodospirillales bacterium]|nr:outer membrane protein assembly factor BamE [Rhodospirillales bacterium]MDH3790475.1 outer membrane protein assembly factor BamE [Rhodospirillales bacterium]MDH3910717.1 outer membrane protein assembly factor BamE [Rhodospirillales bacterium]MDH3919955.1 outer membrane protein assembly factor BamE [Rhodospirillales bacterium]MDH3970444.1 outer membrane protein assembly factor BamE [Rhodospirillales bacterium]